MIIDAIKYMDKKKLIAINFVKNICNVVISVKKNVR